MLDAYSAAFHQKAADIAAAQKVVLAKLEEVKHAQTERVAVDRQARVALQDAWYTRIAVVDDVKEATTELHAAKQRVQAAKNVVEELRAKMAVSMTTDDVELMKVAVASKTDAVVKQALAAARLEEAKQAMGTGMDTVQAAPVVCSSDLDLTALRAAVTDLGVHVAQQVVNKRGVLAAST
jgi:hypothetical protein